MRESNGFPQVLEVAPLNSLPYVGPLNGNSSMSGNKANETAEKTGPPAMIFLPSESTPELYSLISQSKTGVALTGSAAMGKVGPTIGLVDIAESDDSYYFRVSLPGVSRDESKSPKPYILVDEVLVSDMFETYRGVQLRNRTRRQDSDQRSNNHGREDSVQTQSGVQDAIAKLMPSRPLHHLFPASRSCQQRRFQR